jgi:hypothetical protein
LELAQGRIRKAGSTTCSNCGKVVPSYDVVNLASIEKGYRRLCGECFNVEEAKLAGLRKFEHLDFEPVRIVDSQGQPHVFHFRTRLFGPGVSLDAFEIRGGKQAGYEFQIIGDPDEDLMVLLGRLVEKIRRALAMKHLTQGTLGLEIADRVVRGHIGWDDDEDGVPLLVIDGREITWDQFGRMMMIFEGWQFKLEIRDKSEEP